MRISPRSFFPLVNGGEAAILFCFIFLYIFVAGGGAWSLTGCARLAGTDAARPADLTGFSAPSHGR